MRLKEIKPGMVIHCKNDEEKKALLEEAERLGYLWTSRKNPIDRTFCHGNTIHFYAENEFADFKHITWSDTTEGAIEFSDLILPELTVEEVLKIRNELDAAFVRDYLGIFCEMSLDKILRNATPEQIIDMCRQWKSDHEKKEPEIETVDICRIIEIQTDGKKRCVHEEDISDGELMYSGDAVEKCRYILKNYCKEHDGEFIAVHEVVSRVKAV